MTEVLRRGPGADRARRRWWLAPLVIAVPTLGVAVVRAATAAGRPPITRDAAFFQHAGWYVATRGAVPYVDLWTLKPPLWSRRRRCSPR